MNQKTISIRKKLITGGVIGSLVILIAMAVGLIYIFGNNRKPEISVNHDDFHSEIGHDVPVLELNQKVDYSGIIITEKINGRTEHIKVTEEMIVSCDDTSTPGKKHLVIKHKHEEITIEFYVMFRVEFIVDGEVVSSQLIDDMAKLEIPTPVKTGHEFVCWSPEVPQVITGNSTFEAIFRDQPKEIPLLSNLNAIYGDKLDKFTLPSNEYGRWVFVDDVTSSVGNVGENTFQVKFVPTNTELKEIQGEVKINVSKKKLEFKNLITSFIYDGETHKPLYELDVEGLKIEYIGNEYIDVGTYNYMYIIDDENYEGSISGTFEIVKHSNITISVNDIIMNYGDVLPEITYSVKGIEDTTILGIEVIVPNYKNVGIYENALSVKVANENYDVTIIPGSLIIKSINLYDEEELKNIIDEIKLDLEIINPETNEVKPVVYLDKLMDVKINNNNPNGYYTWKNPELVFEKVGKHQLVMVFTPYSNNYNVQEFEYEINVEKKSLNIIIHENTYTYTGDEYTIHYQIEDGSYEHLEVTGNKVEVNAGNYSTILRIIDDNYQGSISTSLVIAKATPETDFTITLEDVYWNSRLRDVKLPENYNWILPNEILSLVGTYSYNAVYDNGNPNYNTVPGLFTINVIKQVPTVTALEKYEFVYDGINVLTKLTEITQSHIESNLEFYLGENKITELANVGEYEVTIILPESDHYQEASIKTNIVIEQFVVESPKPYTATYTTLLSSLKLPTSEFGTWLWDCEPNETVGEVGINKFVAKFVPINSNYKELSVEVDVVVEQKVATIEITKSRYTYDTNIHYLEYKVLDGDMDITSEVNILGNTGRTNAGNLLCNLVIDNKNYRGNAIATLYIDKADPVIEWPVVKDVDWNTMLSDISLPEGFSWESTSTFNPYNEKLSKIGRVTYRALYNKHDENYNIIYQDISFNVIKLDATINAQSKYNFVYDGTIKILTDIVSSHDESIVKFVYEKDGLVYENLRNEGTYNVTIILPESDHYNEARFTTVVVIDKAAINLEPIEYDAIYGQTLGDVKLPDNPYGIWSWANGNEESVGNVGANEFIAIFTPTNPNYKEDSKTVIVHVSKKYVTLRVLSSTFTYNGNPQSIQYQVLDGTNDITELVKILGNVSLTNVGSRTAKLIVSSDSYYSDEISATLVVEKADYTPIYPTDLTATYGDSLSSVKLINNSENIDGTWEWKEITSVGNAGTNNYKAIFTPTSSNYNSHEASLEIEVTKKELTISITKDTYTYSNELHKLEYVVTGFVNGDSTADITGNDGLTNAGSKEFTLVVDDANYTGSVTHTLTINKARVEAPTSYNATYYDQLGTITLPTSSFGTWEWVDGSNASINFVGTEEVEIRFNSTSDNYESYTTKVLLTSVKRLLTFTSIESSFVYDGTDKSVKYELVGLVDGLTTNDILVNGNGVQNIVGSQELTLVVSNKFYYSEPLEVTLEVTKATPNVTFGKVYEIEWFDGITLNAIKLDSNFVWVNPTTSLEVGENQVFDVKYVPVSSNYEEVNGTYKVTVTRINPTITYSGPNSSVYAGSDINLGSFISHNNKDLGVVVEIRYYELVDEVYQEVSKIHDAGSYKVVVSLPQTAHYNEKEIEFEYVVEKKPSVTNPLDDRTAIYGQQLKDLADFPEVSDGVWAWENPDAYVGNVGENTFKAVFTPNDENVLPSSQDIIVKVSPKEIKFENVLSTFDYTGTEHKVTWSLSETPEGVAVATTGTISMTDYVEGGKPFTLTIDGNANYCGYYEGTIIINQVNPDYGTIPTFTVTYGDTFESIKIPTHESGEWSFIKTGSVGEHGVYTNIELVFTPDSQNYKIVTVYTTLTVNKADSVIENNLPEVLTYLGTDLNIANYFTLNHSETSLLFNGLTKVEVIDAKTYTVTISANETSNYNSVSTTVVFTVNPATPDTDFSNIFDNIPYGTKLETITLPTGYSWDNPETLLTNVASGQEFDATYTPSSTNYHSVTGKFTVNVVKADATVSAENIERTYEREFDVLSLLSITTSHSQTNVEFYLGEEQITSLINAGTYTLTIKLPGNENYNEVSTTVIVKINKARVEAPSAITTTYGTTLSDLSLPISEFGKWTWNQETTTSTGVVGTRNFSATFTSESDNYETYTTSVSVTVNKKVLTIDVIKSEYEYDGQEHEITYKVNGIVGTDSPLIIGSEKLTDAGSVTFTLTTNAANYSLSQECTLIINKKDTSEDFPELLDVEYNTTIEEVEEEVQKLSTYGTVTLTEYIAVFNVGKAIGEVGESKAYLLTFVSNNPNYADFEKVITITVTRIKATLEADSRYEFVYDGNDVLSRITNVVTNNNESSPKYYINSSEVTSLVNAGTYTVEIVYEESEHYTKSSTRVEIFIDKATPAPSFDLTYDVYWNTKLSDITLPEDYYWINGETVLETVEDGQKFEVVYDLKDANYYIVEGKVEVNVKKIAGEITAVENQEFTFIENNEGFKVEASSNHNEVSLEYGYVYNGNENVNAIINAGTYEVTITLPETEHYEKAVVAITVIVKQAEYKPVVPTDLTATYGDSLTQVTLANSNENIEGTWEWKEITSVGNAGTNNYKAIFTPEDKNYLSSEHELSVKVTKKELTITVDQSIFEYDETEKKIYYSITGIITGDNEPNIKDYVGLVEIGNKDVILEIDDENYYGSISCTLIVTKGRNNVSISDLGTLTSTYNNKPSSIELPQNEEGTWKFENENDPIQKVGNVEMTIWFIPNDQTHYADQKFIVNVYVNKIESVVTATIPNDLEFINTNIDYTEWFELNHSYVSSMDYTIRINDTIVENVYSAGKYTITVSVERSDYTTEYEHTFEFSVAQATYTPSVVPSNVQAEYGDELSTIEIENPSGNIEGTWVVTTTGIIKEVENQIVNVTFIPKDQNYAQYTTSVEVIVSKKLVEITIDKNSFGYNGNVQIIEYTIKGILEDDEEPIVSGNTGRQYVGSESFTLTIESEFYQGSITTILTIEAAYPEAPELASSYSIYKGLPLTEITLESSELGKWVFTNPTTVIGELESYHPVEFIPHDENYLIITDSVLVKIVQKPSEITKNIPENLVYNEEVFDFASWFTLNHDYSTLNCVLVGDVTEMRNAGTYTIRFSVEGNNYCTSIVDEIVTVTILPAKYTPSVMPSGVNAIYGDSSSDVEIDNPLDNIEGTWSIISLDMIREIGTVEVGVRFTPTSTNYSTYEDTINITVGRKQVSLVITNDTHPYNGSIQTLEYIIDGLIADESADRIPTVLGNEGIINVSESGTEFTLTLAESEYYVLDNAVTHALTITPVMPIITVPVYSGRNYYENEFDIGKDYATAPIATFNGENVSGQFIYPQSSTIFFGAAQTTYVASNYGYKTGGEKIISTFELKFIPDSDNFVVPDDEVILFEVAISPVAFNGNYYYGTVEKALADAKTASSSNGATVEVILNSEEGTFIRNDCTINSGVTLVVPYAQGVRNKSDHKATSTNGSIAGTVTNKLTIAPGVILTNAGTLEVGGIISGGGAGLPYSGHTTEQFATIYLDNDAEIISTGTINVFGYINELAPDNGSKVTIQSGAIYQPFIVRDFAGGGVSKALYEVFGSYHTTPFNQFVVRNVSSTLEIQYDGKLFGIANLYASSQHNATDINLISKDSSALVQLTNSTHSKVVAKYNTDSEIIKFDVYGGADLNYMTLKITIIPVIMVFDISTEEVYFPIDWQFNVSLMPTEEQKNKGEIAQFNFEQRTKLLPGAKLTIGEGAKLRAADLTAYESYVGTQVSMPGTPYPLKDPAEIIVEGELLATNLAGRIVAGAEGAKLTVEGSSSITSYETKTTNGLSGTDTKIATWLPIENSLKLCIKNGAGIFSRVSADEYTATFNNETGIYEWYSVYGTINYDANGGKLPSGTPSSSTPNEIPKDGFEISPNLNSEIVPTRDHYIFGGWYLDNSYEKPAPGARIFSNVYIYAKWIPIEYELIYNVVDEDGNLIDLELNNDIFDIEDVFDLTSPTGDFVFDGWYIDSKCETRISTFVASYFADQLWEQYLETGSASVTVYGIKLPSNTNVYTITFVDGVDEFGNEIVVQTQQVIETKPTKYSLPDLGAGLDDNTGYPFYFDGWYDENDVKYENSDKPIEGNITLRAKWIEKKVLTVKIILGSTSLQSTVYIKAGDYTLPMTETNITSQGEKIVWFINDETRTSSNYIIGGNTINVTDNILLVGESYYVITNEIYTSKNFSLQGKTNVLFSGVTFNETYTVSVNHEGSGNWKITKSSNSIFAKAGFSKLILDKCDFTNEQVASGETYAKGNRRVLLIFTNYFIAYNGLFADCSSLTTVIANLKEGTTLPNHLFANCSSLSSIILSNSATPISIATGESVAYRPLDYTSESSDGKVVGA